MATEVHNHPSDQSITSLVGGIVSDVQDLVKQQLQLVRKEVEGDLRKTAEAASLWVFGLVVLFLGGIALCLMLAHLLHWLTGPPGFDQATIPLWGCHAIVGVFLVIVGGCLLAAGRKKIASVHPLDNPATEALKENVQWLTTPK
jgi:cytochrome c-type biogenesis protein CcmH/NrfF